MKVLLYSNGMELLKYSGIARAVKHQTLALQSAGVEVTTSPRDTYDILHINTVLPNTIGMIKKAKKENKLVVVHAHSTEEDFRNSFILSNQLAKTFRWWIKTIYMMADVIVTPTPYAKSLLQGYGIHLPIYAISNGVNLAKYQAHPYKESAFRQHFQLKPGEKVVVSVGLWIKRKGILDFIEVAKRMPHLWFIWFGFTEKALITTEIKEALANLPVNVLMPGYITGDIIEGAFSGADAFFFPSYEETEGIVVLEALASRQTVIARDIPVYQPWLKSGVNSYLGKTNDDFVDLIDKVLHNKVPSTREQAYQTAIERDLPHIGQQLKKVYEEGLVALKKTNPVI